HAAREGMPRTLHEAYGARTPYLGSRPHGRALVKRARFASPLARRARRPRPVPACRSRCGGLLPPSGTASGAGVHVSFPLPFLTDDSEATFKHFAKKVEHLPAEELEHWNADAEIVRVNVGRAVA